MPNPPRKLAFVLAATEQGSLIVNRFDYHALGPDRAYGVGHQLLENAAYEGEEVDAVRRLLDLRRRYFGDGVAAVDCGANVGVHALSWARQMTGWGRVIAIEAQERIYYALAGNIALNNCFNIRAIHAAVAERDGALRIPEPDYLAPASFGSLELRWSEGAEFIGQRIDYADERMVPVRAVALDSLGLTRVDLLKIDVEGMEIEALAGACALITAHHPLILVEHIKSGRDRLGTILGGFGYAVHEFGLNLLAVHPSDPSGTHIKRQRG